MLYQVQHAVIDLLTHMLHRVIFGGFFIRGHSYTMTTLSFAIRFWSKVCTSSIMLLLKSLTGCHRSALIKVLQQLHTATYLQM